MRKREAQDFSYHRFVSGGGYLRLQEHAPGMNRSIPGNPFHSRFFTLYLLSRHTGRKNHHKSRFLFPRENPKKQCPKNVMNRKERDYLMATKLRALLVFWIDFAGSFSVPIMARMASMFSTTTSASWWMAWKR